MLRKLAFTIAVLTSAVIMITEIFNPAFRESHPIASVLGGGLYGCASVSPSSEIIVRQHHPTSTAPHQDAVYGWGPGSSLLKNMRPVVAMMDQQPNIQGTLQFGKGRYGVTESGSLQLITRATGGLLPFLVENMFNAAINKWGLPNLIENGELVIEYENSDIPGVVVQLASTYNIPHTDIGNKRQLILNQQESGTFSIPLKNFYDGYPGKSGWFLSPNQLLIVLFVYYGPNIKFPGSPEIVNEKVRILTAQKNPFFVLPQAPVPGNKFRIKSISLQLHRPGLSWQSHQPDNVKISYDGDNQTVNLPESMLLRVTYSVLDDEKNAFQDADESRKFHNLASVARMERSLRSAIQVPLLHPCYWSMYNARLVTTYGI